MIRDYRDRGCPEPEPIPPELLHEMMTWLVCEDVPEEYVPAADGGDGARRARRPTGGARSATAAERATFPVVVIGCGQSGLLAGIRLQEAGIPFTIVEKNAGVGGTWWENSYPGARVDVGNHFYCYSFEPSDHWTEYFARQPELQRYFQSVMDKHGIGPHVRWETEVLGATWDEGNGHLVGAGPSADGTEDVLDARAVISAVGQLNRPHLPEIPGQERFAGPAFHSARWDHDVDLAGTAGGHDRRRGQRIPDRPDHRPRRRPPDGLPAHGPVDVPQPELPRHCRARACAGRCATCPSTAAGTGS